jgi:hypothetical protein
VAEDGILDLERRDGRPPREHSKEPPDDGVDQEEEHRQMLRVSGAAGELNFPRPTRSGIGVRVPGPLNQKPAGR